MSRTRELERDRQIADVQAILANSLSTDEPDRDLGEAEVRELTGFGDGFDPPRGAWRARLQGRRLPVLVFLAVAVLSAAATALVTWFLRPAATAVEGSPTTIASGDERADGAASAAPASPASPASAASTSPATIVVAVVGQVVHPGLVTLPAGARVSDAISAAGGALPGADLTTINIARKLSDGEQIAVGIPSTAGGSATGAAQPDQGGAAQPVNLNSAGLADLDALPGIGPVLAQRIIDFREENGPFASVDELANVSGVGPSILEKIKDQVTV